MVYASEPAAVDAVLADIPRSYRLDLDQKTGEIAWVSVNRIVLRKLQYDTNALHLGSTSIVLAISQSGQTFPTLQATHMFEQLRREAAIGELFLLTGEICSLMGTAISQYYYPQSTFTRRIFINGSGRRTAEPTTVAVAAAQATLTELLLYLAKRLQQRFPGRNGALGMTLTSADLMTLERIKDDFIDRSVIPIVGTSVSGDPINSPTHRQLIRSSGKWALHITETPLAWGIHALYILISVGFQAPLVQTLCRSIFALANLSVPGWLLPAIGLADIAIYIFGSWLWTLGLRYLQGRPLLARTGKRTLVIGDVPWVHQLLKVYVSKLFSLSYGIASLDVHGANPQDHMLHNFGHRVVRGTLVFLGIPDGRTDRLQKENESAAMMTGKQASGVRNFQTGADIIVLGHNPTIAARGFQAAIILPSDSTEAISTSDSTTLAELCEARFGSFDRLLASYVFFWWLSKQVASFPLLRYQHWKSQSRTRIMTTAAPVSRSITLEPKSYANELQQRVVKK